MMKYHLGFCQKVVIRGMETYIRVDKYYFDTLHDAIKFAQLHNAIYWCVYFEWPEYRLVARSQYEE